jgi:hypothetical protein
MGPVARERAPGGQMVPALAALLRIEGGGCLDLGGGGASGGRCTLSPVATMLWRLLL